MADNTEIMEDSVVTETAEIAVESTETFEKKPRRRKKNEKESALAENTTADETTEIAVPAPTESVTSEIPAKKSVYKTGDVFETKLSLLYKSCVAPKHSKVIKGKFYIWNDEVYHGRIRLTDSPSGVGRVDRIIGWIKVSGNK